MADSLGVGLIGYGAIGRMHALCYRALPLVYPDLPRTPQIVAVATASEASAERAQRELGDIFVTTDYRDLLARADVDVIDCCAPTGDHGAMALATLGAGKRLICEKPLAATGDEAAAIASLADQQQLHGSVFYHLRFIPAIQQARRLIEDGLLGEIYSFQMHYYRASNLQRDRPITWRFAGPGSGVLQDLGSHLIDLVEYLLGPATRVSARLRTMVSQRRGPDGSPITITSDDAATLQIELAGGGLGVIEASKVVPGAGDDIRIAAYGSAGALLFDTNDPNGLQVVEGTNSPVGGRRIATLSFAQPAAAILQSEKPTGALQWYLSTLEACCRAVLGESSNATSFAEAAHVQRVIDSALRSSAADGAWIVV